MSVFDTPHRPVLSHLEPSRRMFIATGLAGGLALAVQPASAARGPQVPLSKGRGSCWDTPKDSTG
jgi:hypothetical protein